MKFNKISSLPFSHDHCKEASRENRALFSILPPLQQNNMSANDYYQGSSQHYQAYNAPGSAPYLHNGYGQYGQSAPSVAPSYHSEDPLEYRPSHPPSNNLHPNDAYTDEIPLKDQTRIQTNQLQSQSTSNAAYPPSPESQNPNPALLPPSDRSRRNKKKGGWFSGRVPWFVYFISLVQISVFIGEIIKNCKWIER